MNVLQLISNANQYRDAELLRSHGVPIIGLGVADGQRVRFGTGYNRPHTSEGSGVSAGFLAAALLRYRKRGSVLLVGQDVGPMERLAVGVGRKLGYRIALLPDGVCSFPPSDWSPRLARSQVGRLAARSGLFPSYHPSIGNTRPDLVLSWGVGWEPYWKSLGLHHIRSVGSPRSFDLGKSGVSGQRGRILVASQPFADTDLSASTVHSWYEFLDGISQAEGITVRLHPRELQPGYWQKLGRPSPVSLTGTESSHEAFATHGAVVSPASTILLEAASYGLRVLAIATSEGLDDFRRRIPAFADGALPFARLDGLRDATAFVGQHARPSEAWAERFLQDPSGAPQRAADALVDFARGVG